MSAIFKPIKPLLLGCAISSAALLAGCSSLKFPGVYRITIFQGNFIEQEKVDQLKEGMNRRQVQFLLGTPLIVDTFNQDRWDYIYRANYPDGSVKEAKLTVHFENDKVVKFEGNALPRSDEEIAAEKAELERAKQEYEDKVEKARALAEKRKTEAENKSQDEKQKTSTSKKEPQDKRKLRPNRGATR